MRTHMIFIIIDIGVTYCVMLGFILYSLNSVLKL